MSFDSFNRAVAASFACSLVPRSSAAPFVVLSRSVRFHATFAGGETTTGFAGLAPDGAEDYTALAGQNGTMQEVAQGQQADNAQVPQGTASVSVQGSAGTSVSLAAPSLGSAGITSTAALNGGIIPQCNHHGLDSYYATDHLGTVRFVKTIDETGTEVATSTHDYEPFGVEITPTDACDNTHKFTGHERDIETGNDYMHARYYGGNVARFMSPDKLGGKPLNPQSWNKYWYADDRPTVAIDPNGLDTYLLLVGRGYQATTPPYSGPGGLGNQGLNFKNAAETRKKEIMKSPGFDPEKDKVEIKDVGTGKEAKDALNKKYDSGPIKDVETFSHGGRGALNFGEGPETQKGTTPEKWLTKNDLAQTHPDFAPGATATFNACDSGLAPPGGTSIAQSAAELWGIPASGAPTSMSFDNPYPTTANPDVHMIPDYGMPMIPFPQTTVPSSSTYVLPPSEQPPASMTSARTPIETTHGPM